MIFCEHLLVCAGQEKSFLRGRWTGMYACVFEYVFGCHMDEWRRDAHRCTKLIAFAVEQTMRYGTRCPNVRTRALFTTARQCVNNFYITKKYGKILVAVRGVASVSDVLNCV